MEDARRRDVDRALTVLLAEGVELRHGALKSRDVFTAQTALRHRRREARAGDEAGYAREELTAVHVLMFALLARERHPESELGGIGAVEVAVQGAVARTRPLAPVLVLGQRRLIEPGDHRVATLDRTPVDLGDDFGLRPAVALAVFPQAIH